MFLRKNLGSGNVGTGSPALADVAAVAHEPLQRVYLCNGSNPATGHTFARVPTFEKGPTFATGPNI